MRLNTTTSYIPDSYISRSPDTTAIAHARQFHMLYPPTPDSTANVSVTYEYQQEAIGAQVRAAFLHASNVTTLLRTTDAYADRSVLLLAYQLHDTNGNVRVRTSNLSVTVTLTRSSSEDAHIVECDTSGLTSILSHYLGYCRAAALPEPWFRDSGTASLSLAVSYDGIVEQRSTVADLLTLHKEPSWLTSKSNASLPSKNWLTTSEDVGAYATMPVSPVYAGEEFAFDLFAHTGTYPVSSFNVWAILNPSKLTYVSYTQSSLFQTVTLDQAGGQGNVLKFSSFGMAASVTDSDVTGTSIYLLTVRATIGISASDGVNSGLFTVYTQQLVNPGTYTFVSGRQGFVLDYRGGEQSSAALQIRSPQPRGIFAYTSTGTLANVAVINAKTTTYPLTVVMARDIDTLDEDWSLVATQSTCVSQSHPHAFIITDCSISIDTTCNSGTDGTTVEVSYNGLTTTVPLKVYYPSHISMHVLDQVLNRIELSLPPSPPSPPPIPPPAQPPAPPAPPPSGPDGDRRDRRKLEHYLEDLDADVPRPPPPPPQVPPGQVSWHCDGPLYQWTTIVLDVDGLDASPLVSYQVSDTSVVGITQHNKVNGYAVGSAVVTLVGAGATPVHAFVNVSDESVLVSRLVSKAVTSVEWLETLPSEITPIIDITAHALLVHALNVEGATGRIMAQIEWGDGTMQDAPHSLTPGIDELHVSIRDDGERSAVSDLVSVPPSGDKKHWEVTVPRGALYHIGEIIYTEWRICGLATGTFMAWAAIELPKPIGITVTPARARLTTPSDGASLTPISVPVTSFIQTKMNFEDATSSDYSDDDRVNHTIVEAECAFLRGIDLVMRNHTECSSITLKSAFNAGRMGYDSHLLGSGAGQSLTVADTYFYSTVVIPVAYLNVLEVEFVADPVDDVDVIGPTNIVVDRIDPIECTNPMQFHKAAARARARLSDNLNVFYAVTAEADFVSQNTSILTIDALKKTRVISVGSVDIIGYFGGSSRTTTLTVTDELETLVSQINVGKRTRNTKRFVSGI